MSLTREARAELNAIFAEADRLAADHEVWLARRSATRVHNNSGLRFRTNENARIEEPPPFSQLQNVYDCLLGLAEEAGAATGKLERRIFDLEKRLEEMRSEIDVLRGDNVLKLRGRPDAAA